MGTRTASSVAEWLEALIPEDDRIAGSIAAITVASSLVRMDPTFAQVAFEARIILDEEGELAAPSVGIFRRAPLPIDVDARYVHAEVEATTGELLANLGVRAVDAERILKVKLREERHKWGADDWTPSGRSSANLLPPLSCNFYKRHVSTR